MTPKDAYMYSAITGSEYLSDHDPALHFSPKGLQSVFALYRSNQLSTGLFACNNNDGIEFYHTTANIAQSRPFIKVEDKYIIPLEVTSSSELSAKQGLYKKLIEAGKEPSNYLVTLIRMDTFGGGLEPFLEYVFCRYYKESGYITENQIPLRYGIGTPDAGAFHMPEIFTKLRDRGYIDQGAFLLELASLSVFGKSNYKAKQENLDEDLVVGEAKPPTVTAQIERQLDKYSSIGLFDRYYRILPSPVRNSSKYGLITFNEIGKITVLDGKIKFPINRIERRLYIAWLENYFKFYLLSNLNWPEFCKILGQKSLKLTKTSVINAVNRLEFDNVLDVLESSLEKF